MKFLVILYVFIICQVGTLVGNLSIKLDHPEFVSDLFVILEAVDALLVIRMYSQSIFVF